MIKRSILRYRGIDIRRERKEYNNERLQVADLDSSPFGQMVRWYEFNKLHNGSSKIEESNAMSVSTLDEEGYPVSRMVLMKDIQPDGIVFFTNYESSKGRDIARCEKVSLLVYWTFMNRQVRIRGKASKCGAAESDAYFDLRPVGSRIAAIVSPQSRRIESIEELEREVKERMEEVEKTGIEPKRPENWGGYKVVPDRFEFWQGNNDRLHDRFLYERKGAGEGSGWEISRLAP